MFFWLLLIAVIIMIEWSVAYEVHEPAIGVLLVFLGTAWFFGFMPWTWVVANPISILAAAAMYMVIGILWGFVKWYFHMLNEKDNLSNIYRKSYEESKNPTSSDYFASGSETYYQYLIRKNMIPKAKNSKYLISVWMVWWPFSMVWTAMNDIVRRLYNWVIDKYLYVYDAISAHVFK